MEKQQKQQSGNKSKRNERKGTSLKIHIWEQFNQCRRCFKLSCIVSSNNSISKAMDLKESFVAYSFGKFSYMHWNPISNRNIVGDYEDESGFGNLDPNAVFAEPGQRKEKKALDLSLWKEPMQSDDFAKSKGRGVNKSHLGKAERQTMDGEAIEQEKHIEGLLECTCRCR
ncbi:hypothetical protein PTKIN_Ptkin02bG0218900 [Pterospermum kingtungense]